MAPADVMITTDTVLTLWWETHEDTKYYRLQLVHPDFEQTEQLIADFVVLANQLTLELEAGDYAWRVPASDTEYNVYEEPYNPLAYAPAMDLLIPRVHRERSSKTTYSADTDKW